jgi:succinyl-diaminopimelate desuccinylase
LAGAPTEPWGLEAATDAREFVKDGIPAIIWGLGSLDQAHTIDEWIDLDEAETGLKILKQAARELLASK